MEVQLAPRAKVQYKRKIKSQRAVARAAKAATKQALKNLVAQNQLSTNLIKQKVSPNLKKKRKNKKGIVKSEVRDIESCIEIIARSLATPGTDAAIRWSSEFSEYPVAVANPWTLDTAEWAVGATQTSLGMPATDYGVCLFREPTRAIIEYDANKNRVQTVYRFSGGSNFTAEDSLLPQQSWTVILTPSEAKPGIYYYLHTPFATPSTSYAPHGSLWFAGAADEADANARFFWIDADADSVSSSVSGTFTIAPVTTGQLRLSLCKWTPEGVVKEAFFQDGTANGAGSVTISVALPANQSGYYSFHISNPSAAVAWTANPVVTLLQVSMKCSIFAHRCLPSYDANFAAAPGVRVLAASVMYTDNASITNLQGKIVGQQVPAGVPWTEKFPINGASSFFNAVSRKNLSSTKKIRNGIYGFLKPAQPTDMDVREYITVEGTSLVDSFYPLTNKTSYLMLYGQVTVEEGRDGYLTIHFGIDYQTEDVWRAVSQSEYSADEYRKAIEMCKNFVQWHENPTHVGQLWGMIRRGAKTVANATIKYGPTALKIAEGVAKMM